MPLEILKFFLRRHILKPLVFIQEILTLSPRPTNEYVLLPGENVASPCSRYTLLASYAILSRHMCINWTINKAIDQGFNSAHAMSSVFSKVSKYIT